MRQTFPSGYAYEDTHGYSRAVRVGSQIFVSGTVARGDDLKADAYRQSVAALTLIAGALTTAGGRLSDVVRTVVYVTDIEDANLVSRAHAEVFGAIRPASTLVEVSRFLVPDAKVEIEATAVVTG